MGIVDCSLRNQLYPALPIGLALSVRLDELRVTLANVTSAAHRSWARGPVIVLGLMALASVAGCGSSSISAGPFQGAWHVHTDYLVINADGTGRATWPIHVFCGTGTGIGRGGPPCDKIAGSGRITDGGLASLTITSVHGDTALGQIADSTVQSTLPDGPVALLVDPVNDVVHMAVSRPTTSSPYGTVPLCGPKAYAKSLREGSAALFNCGA